ncbi:MAG: pteridine reductase [Pseudomonadota bacterium]|nr:pteridine reductase [Pseudomonadota bacterium]
MSHPQNKVALITGSARRIGAFTAEYLHQRNYDIILHYRASGDLAKTLRDKLNAARAHSCIALHADLADPEALQQLAEQTKSWKHRLDLLVNNASSYYPTQLGETTQEHWQDLFSSNARAPYFLIQSLHPLLQASQGNVVNIIDAMATHPNMDFIPYNMAKTTLHTLTRSMAKLLAPSVRVNSVSPGVMLWPVGDHNPSAKEKEKIVAQVPLQRMGTEQDIARTIYFLAEDAPYITGQDIAVDGGQSLL